MLKEVAHGYLGDYCLGTGRHLCRGKLHRFLVTGMLPPNDDNEAYPYIMVYDRCIECCMTHREIGTRYPIPGLEELFQRWRALQITRLEFDQAITQAFSPFGGQWAEKTA